MTSAEAPLASHCRWQLLCSGSLMAPYSLTATADCPHTLLLQISLFFLLQTSPCPLCQPEKCWCMGLFNTGLYRESEGYLNRLKMYFPVFQAQRHMPMHLRRKMKQEKKKPLHFEILPPNGSLLPGQRVNIQVKFMPTEEVSTHCLLWPGI